MNVAAPLSRVDQRKCVYSTDHVFNQFYKRIAETCGQMIVNYEKLFIKIVTENKMLLSIVNRQTRTKHTKLSIY